MAWSGDDECLVIVTTMPEYNKDYCRFFFHCRDPYKLSSTFRDGIEAFFVTQLGFDSHCSFESERSAFGFGVCSLPGFQS